MRLKRWLRYPKKRCVFFITDVGNDIVIELTDSGRGIPPEDINKLFEQGYSTKGKQDRGYGLSIVKSAIDALQGSIEIHQEKQEGTVFTVYLPKVVTQ